MADFTNWRVTENGWTWVGPGDAPGVDPFHVPAAYQDAQQSYQATQQAAAAAVPAGPVSANPWGSFNGNFQGGLSPDLINYYGQRTSQLGAAGAFSGGGADYGSMSNWDVNGGQWYLDDPNGRYRLIKSQSMSAPFLDEYGRPMVRDKNGNAHPYDPTNPNSGYLLWDKQSQQGGSYDPSGKYVGALDLAQEIDPMDLVGIAMVAAPFAAAIGGVGAGAAGAGAGTTGGTTAGATGAGITGFGDAGLMYGGADAAAAGSLGGGASVYGGSALGAGTAAMGAGGAGGVGGAGGAGGITGFGDAGTMYGGADAASAASLGGGGSMGAGGSWSMADILGNISGKNMLGLGATALGAFGGTGGGGSGGGGGSTLDDRLAPYIYGNGGVVPLASGLLNTQMPYAQAQAGLLGSVGSGLLSTPTNPNQAQNPYLKSIADDMSRRTADLLGANNLQIAGNAVASGGLGGSRMGVAQGLAASRAADSLQGQIAGLYGNAYESDANRALQKIGLGAGLLGQSQQQAWGPLNAASNIYKPYSNLQSADSGSNWQSMLGGAIGGAALANKLGWWS